MKVADNSFTSVDVSVEELMLILQGSMRQVQNSLTLPSKSPCPPSLLCPCVGCFIETWNVSKIPHIQKVTSKIYGTTCLPTLKIRIRIYPII
jgi:hypothetical protein